MDLFLKGALILAAALAVWGLVRAAAGHRLFVVKIVRGEPRAVVGTVTPAFLRCVREVAAEHAIKKGKVSGQPTDDWVRLEFSSQFPQAARQQIRNWWGASGWSANRRMAPPKHG